jgi:hypothetical protein
MAPETSRPEPARDELSDAARIAELRCPFGPVFFLTHLKAFIRDRCPEPAEGRPVVRLHLIGGEVLDVCHVIGLAPGFVALAVYEGGGHRMRTEIVPYLAIVRVTIAEDRRESEIGFGQAEPPLLLGGDGPVSPEDLLRKAAEAAST